MALIMCSVSMFYVILILCRPARAFIQSNSILIIIYSDDSLKFHIYQVLKLSSNF